MKKTEEIKESEPAEDNEKQDSEKQTEENAEEGRKDFQTSDDDAEKKE